MNEIFQRTDAALRLVNAFKLERIACLALNGFSFVVFLALIFYHSIGADSSSFQQFFSSSVPAGIMAAANGRMLSIWNSAVKIVAGQDN